MYCPRANEVEPSLPTNHHTLCLRSSVTCVYVFTSFSFVQGLQMATVGAEQYHTYHLSSLTCIHRHIHLPFCLSIRPDMITYAIANVNIDGDQTY
jgi:hypothetical protein